MRGLLYAPCYTVDRDAQSLRITQFADVLSSRGWQFDVVTTPAFFLHDETLRAKLRNIQGQFPHLRVFQTHPALVATLRDRLYPLGRLYGPVVRSQRADQATARLGEKLYRGLLRELYGRYHSVFARIGDPDWIVPGVFQGLRLLSMRRYHLVFASASWYFASHIAAAIVSALRGLPLVLDYGDPWGPEPPARPKWTDRVSEALVLRGANKAIVTNSRARDSLLTHQPFLAPSRVAVISQGYRAGPRPHERAARDQDWLTIGYTGAVYSEVQSSSEFFQALRVVNSRGISVRLVRAGPDLSSEEKRWIDRLGVSAFVQDRGHLFHEDALALQRESTVLLVIGTRSRHQIPGKTIEYIGAGRPIFCLSTGEGDLAAEFVKEHGLGVVAPNDAESIVDALSGLHRLWHTGKLETIYRPKDVERFSWQHLGGRLDGIFRGAIAEDQRQPRIAAQREDDQGPDMKSDSQLVGQRPG
jgi:hypothetical protein